MMPRVSLRWSRSRLALGPYILVSRGGLTARVGRAVLCLFWRRRHA